MKELQKEFKSCGFYFKQIKRDGNTAIYEKKSVDNNTVSYEVIQIGSHNGYKLGQNYISPAETYPCNSMWGTTGFTAGTMESAEDRYKDVKVGIKNELTVEKPQRAARKAGSTQPFLTCLVTDEARPSTLKYIESKAKKHGVTADDIRNHYISKPALKLIKQGRSIVEVRELLEVNTSKKVSSKALQRALRLNGRKQYEKQTVLVR